METFSAVTGEFSSQKIVTRSFGIFFGLRLNKRLSKQSWGHRAPYDVTVMYLVATKTDLFRISPKSNIFHCS